MENKNSCAFPADSKTQTDGGLTKLEYFSAQAMQGLLANPAWIKIYNGEPHITPEGTASIIAVQMAHALLEELDKPYNQ